MRPYDPSYPRHRTGGGGDGTHTTGPPPGPYPGTTMYGDQPTMGRYNRGPGAAAVAGMSEADRAAYQARAAAYARARLLQLQHVASMLNPEVQALLQQNMNPVDPAAAWRAISGAFAAQSRQAGYQDPRYYLRYVLPEAMRAHAATPMGGV